jgi:hypothetical protein
MILSLVGFFFIFFAKMFGRSDGDISSAFGGSFGWVIFFVAVILIFSLGSALGPGLLAAQNPSTPPVVQNVTYVNGTAVPADSVLRGTATNDFGTNIVYTIFNPKILGVLFLFILGTLTIIMLGKG